MIKLKDMIARSLFAESKNTKNTELLAKEIDKSIEKIDDSMSYVDFAHAVAKVVKDSYGSHLYDKFKKELNRKL